MRQDKRSLRHGESDGIVTAQESLVGESSEPGPREDDLGNQGAREEGGKLDAEDLAFYRRVCEGYSELAAGDPRRFRAIDSSGPAEMTERSVRQLLAELLGLPDAVVNHAG